MHARWDRVLTGGLLMVVGIFGALQIQDSNDWPRWAAVLLAVPVAVLVAVLERLDTLSRMFSDPPPPDDSPAPPDGRIPAPAAQRRATP